MIISVDGRLALLLGRVQLREYAVLHHDNGLTLTEMIFNSLTDGFVYRYCQTFCEGVEFFFSHELLPYSIRRIRCNIIRPALNATASGCFGDSADAISSALTNSLQSRISGRMVFDAVVFSAPLQPPITYTLGITCCSYLDGEMKRDTGESQ